MDWAALFLFLMIVGRMTGFVLFNPLFGRNGIPGMVKAGFILLLSITVYALSPEPPAIPVTLLELAVRFLLELMLGYFVGLLINFFFYIPLLAGSVVDVQMGMSMGATYDPGSGASVTNSASLLNLLMMLLFFTANGHHTLLRILLTSGEVVPFGAVALKDGLYASMIQLFIECTVLGIKLAMPILAAELTGQVGMGILMKVMPQINIFAINIELKVIIGLGLLLLLMAPFSEFLLKAETSMLQSISALLPLMTG